MCPQGSKKKNGGLSSTFTETRLKASKLKVIECAGEPPFTICWLRRILEEQKILGAQSQGATREKLIFLSCVDLVAQCLLVQIHHLVVTKRAWKALTLELDQD